MLASWKESYDQLRQLIKKQRHYFAKKGPSSQRYGFSISHVWMWELDNKKGWALKMILSNCGGREDSRVPWTAKRSNKSDFLKEISPEYSLEWLNADAEAEAPILRRPDVNSWLIGKDPDAGKDWRQKEKRAMEDETVGWHHQFNGHKLGQTLRDEGFIMKLKDACSLEEKLLQT